MRLTAAPAATIRRIVGEEAGDDVAVRDQALARVFP